MTQLAGARVRQVEALSQRLLTIDLDDERPLHDRIVEVMQELWPNSIPHIYSLQAAEQRTQVVDVSFRRAGDRVEAKRIEDMMNAVVASHTPTDATLGFSRYAPLRPEASTQNRAMLLREVLADLSPDERVALMRRHRFDKAGLEGLDQLRALVCHRGVLNAWVGTFRETPFNVADRQALQLLVPSLQQRLVLEQRLSQSAVLHRATTLTLEQLPHAAAIVDGNGSVMLCNQRLKQRFDAAPETTRISLRAAARATTAEWHCTPLKDGRGALLEERGLRPVPRMNLEARVKEWRLTPREAEVCALLVEGLANRVIAAVLGCAERTAEVHVRQVLKKADVATRAELVTRVWR